MKLFAKFMSGIMHPLLMPLLGTILILNYSYLALLSTPQKWIAVAVVLFFTAAIPAISITMLYKMGKIKTIALNDREDRPIPYIICLSGYLLGLLFMYKLQLPLWSIAFMVGGLLSIVINIIVNRWWKISAHLAGMGGVVAITAILSGMEIAFAPAWLLPATIIVAGLLGSSRVYLGRHTLMQVITGTTNGFLSVYLCTHLALTLGA